MTHKQKGKSNWIIEARTKKIHNLKSKYSKKMENSCKQNKNWMRRLLNGLCCCRKQYNNQNIEEKMVKYEKIEQETKIEKQEEKNSETTKQIEIIAIIEKNEETKMQNLEMIENKENENNNQDATEETEKYENQIEEKETIMEKTEIIEKNENEEEKCQNMEIDNTEETEEKNEEARIENLQIIDSNKKEIINQEEMEKLETIIEKTPTNMKKIEINENEQKTFHMEIVEGYLKHEETEEEENLMPKNYLNTQPNFSIGLRVDLIDSLFAIQDDTGMQDETVFLAVKILDTYLENTWNLDVADIFNSGVASLILAEKWHNRTSLKAIYRYLHWNGCNYEPEKQIEMDIFRKIGYKLHYQLSYEYLHTFLMEMKEECKIIARYAEYILKLALLNYETRFYADPELASAALYISLHMSERKWTTTMESITGYSLHNMGKIIMVLNSMLLIQWMDMDARSIHEIYSREELFKISEMMPKKTFELFKPVEY